MTERNVRHYANLLVGFATLIAHLEEIVDDHDDCPGCFLCESAAGMLYTIRQYESLTDCDAPYEIVLLVKQDRGEPLDHHERQLLEHLRAARVEADDFVTVG